MVIPAHPLALNGRAEARRRSAAVIDAVLHRRGCRWDRGGGPYDAVRDSGSEGRAAGIRCWNWRRRRRGDDRVMKIAGVCGPRAQAMREAELAASLRYDAALLILGALREASVAQLLDHSRAVASVIPVSGVLFAAGGWGTRAAVSVLAAVCREIERGDCGKVLPSTAIRRAGCGAGGGGVRARG